MRARALAEAHSVADLDLHPPPKTRSLPCLSQELKKQELRASGGMAISANQMLSALAEKEREKQKKKALKREQKVRDAPHILLTSAVCSCVTLRLHCKSESLRARPCHPR